MCNSESVIKFNNNNNNIRINGPLHIIYPDIWPDGMLRPSPNHGRQRLLPNDDDDDDESMA